MNIQIIKNIIPDSFRDKAFGSIIGAFIGDACGALAPKRPSDSEVKQCMKMVGGGPNKLGPGQVSDQSEMAMCTIWGLLETNSGKSINEEKQMDTDQIAKHYSRWLNSYPFAID